MRMGRTAVNTGTARACVVIFPETQMIALRRNSLTGDIVQMTISERIFERLAQLGMSQKQFSESTGILQSTISEWKKKKTNPTSEKIMVICQVLGVTPEWLLSGIEKNGSRKNRSDWYVVGKDTELGHLINAYNNMSRERRSRLIG